MDEFPRVIAQHDYAARGPTELSFKQGDLMVVTDQIDDNWLQGTIHGTTESGCIAAAYVRHAKNWRDLVKVSSPATARKAGGSARFAAPPPALPSTPSPRGTPKSGRKAVSGLGLASAIPTGVTKVFTPPGSPKQQRMSNLGGTPMPGMVQMMGGGGPLSAPVGHRPTGSDRMFQPGAEDHELIQPKKMDRGPDRPDLAKALKAANQAARHGGPVKPNAANELKKHMSQMKAKKAHSEKWVDPHEAELTKALRNQSVKFAKGLHEQEAEQNMSELDKRMHAQKLNRDQYASAGGGGGGGGGGRR